MFGFTCPKCGKLGIAPDKVATGKYFFDCENCGEPLTVKAGKPKLLKQNSWN